MDERVTISRTEHDALLKVVEAARLIAGGVSAAVDKWRFAKLYDALDGYEKAYSAEGK